MRISRVIIELPTGDQVHFTDADTVFGGTIGHRPTELPLADIRDYASHPGRFLQWDSKTVYYPSPDAPEWEAKAEKESKSNIKCNNRIFTSNIISIMEVY